MRAIGQLGPQGLDWLHLSLDITKLWPHGFREDFSFFSNISLWEFYVAMTTRVPKNFCSLSLFYMKFGQDLQNEIRDILL